MLTKEQEKEIINRALIQRKGEIKLRSVKPEHRYDDMGKYSYFVWRLVRVYSGEDTSNPRLAGKLSVKFSEEVRESLKNLAIKITKYLYTKSTTTSTKKNEQETVTV